MGGKRFLLAFCLRTFPSKYHGRLNYCQGSFVMEEITDMWKRFEVAERWALLKNTNRWQYLKVE